MVVTIVVLLILAGITISYVMGDNSVFKKASDAKVQTELGKIEERAQVIYSDKLLETASGTLSTKVETSEVISQLISEGHKIEKRPVSAGDITEISLDKENITMTFNKTVEIEVTYEGVDNLFIYYLEVQGKYYKMYSNKGFITIDREPSNLTKSDFEIENETEESTNTLTVVSSYPSIAEATVKETTNNIIEITSKGTTGEATITVTYGEHEKECIVTVKELTLELNKTEYTVTGGQSWKNDLQLVATIKPLNTTTKEVEWKSSNSEIATVDNNGLVKAGTKGGNAIITATTRDGNDLSAECSVITELFGKTSASKTSYTDSDGNIVQIPDGFAVGTSDNVNKVINGLVAQDDSGNQFVWIPIRDVKKSDGSIVTINFGRYESPEGEPIDLDYKIGGDYYELDNYSDKVSSAKNLNNFMSYAGQDRRVLVRSISGKQE